MKKFSLSLACLLVIGSATARPNDNLLTGEKLTAAANKLREESAQAEKRAREEKERSDRIMITFPDEPTLEKCVLDMSKLHPTTQAHSISSHDASWLAYALNKKTVNESALKEWFEGFYRRRKPFLPKQDIWIALNACGTRTETALVQHALDTLQDQQNKPTEPVVSPNSENPQEQQAQNSSNQ